jgi:hypothetical protein
MVLLFTYTHGVSKRFVNGTRKQTRENMHTDRCGNTHRQKCRVKGRGKEVKIQPFRYRDTPNMEPEMYDYTSYNWSH